MNTRLIAIRTLNKPVVVKAKPGERFLGETTECQYERIQLEGFTLEECVSFFQHEWTVFFSENNSIQKSIATGSFGCLFFIITVKSSSHLNVREWVLRMGAPQNDGWTERKDNWSCFETLKPDTRKISASEDLYFRTRAFFSAIRCSAYDIKQCTLYDLQAFDCPVIVYHKDPSKSTFKVYRSVDFSMKAAGVHSGCRIDVNEVSGSKANKLASVWSSYQGEGWVNDSRLDVMFSWRNAAGVLLLMNASGESFPPKIQRIC